MKPLTLAASAASLLLVLASGAPGEIVERIIAKVDGDIITQSEFEARQVAAVQAARIGPDRVEAFLRENNARILQDAIDELLLLHRAYRLGMRVPPDYLQEVIENIKKDNGIQSDDDLLEQLRSEGMSLDDLKRNIERSILVRQVRSRELEPKISVTEAEARAEYDAKRAEFTRPGTVQLQEIVVEGPEAGPRARDLAARARAGEDFSGLARQHSVAPTRDSGGELGQIAKGDLSPELERIASTLNPGGISDPIPTERGFRVLRVADRTPATVTPFPEAKAGILNRMAQARFEQAYDSYMEGLRQAAVVDVRVREVPLQIEVPSAPTLAAPEPAPAAEEDAEFAVTPQATPERVVPAAAPPGEPVPRPSPSPSPQG